jgi:hypothetical protein
MTCPRAKRMLAPRLVSPILVANTLCSPTEYYSVSSSGSGSGSGSDIMTPCHECQLF